MFILRSFERAFARCPFWDQEHCSRSTEELKELSPDQREVSGNPSCAEQEAVHGTEPEAHTETKMNGAASQDSRAGT